MPVADPATGEILFEDGHVLTADDCTLLDKVGVYEISADAGLRRDPAGLHQQDVRHGHYVDFDPQEPAASRSGCASTCCRSCWASTAARS